MLKPIKQKSHVYKAGDDFIQDNTPLFLRGHVFKLIEGQILTTIEAAGLPQKQEDALKSYIRQGIWGTLDSGWVIVLSEEDDSHITNPLFSGSSFNQNENIQSTSLLRELS